jgi:Spy/CpxP family protein refolding chaperone
VGHPRSAEKCFAHLLSPGSKIQKQGQGAPASPARVQFFNGFWHFPTGVAIDFDSGTNFHLAMKQIIFSVALVLAGGRFSAPAQTNDSPAARPAGATDREKATLEKHLKPVLAALNLNDADQTAKVRAILAAQFQALSTWHAQNDAQLKALWNEFNKARGKQDVTNADTALAKIDEIYATFKPQHDKFVSDLAAVLTPEQVETVKDVLTVNKVKVTYDVYLQIFPKLTDEQKAVVLQNLKDAREAAIDAEAMTEKSAFFKKYKIKIEDDYLTAQGYDPKQARKDFAAKQKTDAAAKPADDKE